MRTEDRLRRLDDIESELEALPEVTLSSRSKAGLRAQVMAQVYGGRRATGPAGWWEQFQSGLAALLTPRALARPVAAGVSVLVAVTLAGTTTVSAAIESLPGDGLYPVKTAYEQTRLALSLTEEQRAQTYLSIAASRVDDLARAADSGRLDVVPKIAEEYGASVGHALSLAAGSKQSEKVQQQTVAVQTSLEVVYEKSPTEMRAMLGHALNATVASGASGGPADNPPATGVTQVSHPVPPVTAFHEEVTEPPTVSGQHPQGGTTVVTSKGQVTPEPTPVKDGPISNPPLLPVNTEPLPVKNDIGPATAPLPTKNDPSTVIVEPEKAEPPTAAAPAPILPPVKTDGPQASQAPESPAGTKDQAQPASPSPDQKPAVIQSLGGTLPLPGGR